MRTLKYLSRKAGEFCIWMKFDWSACEMRDPRYQLIVDKISHTLKWCEHWHGVCFKFSYILHKKFHARAQDSLKFNFFLLSSVARYTLNCWVSWKKSACYKKTTRSYHFLYACTISESLRFFFEKIILEKPTKTRRRRRKGKSAEIFLILLTSIAQHHLALV